MYTDEVFLKYLNIILDQQIDDIWKACDAHADMLCLVGCMNMIEFIGGVLNGELGLKNKAKSRFQAGFDIFSDNWKRGIFTKSHIIFDKDDMWDLRNYLTHQYTAKVRKYQTVIITGTEDKKIEFWYGKEQSNGTADDRLIVSVPVTGLMLELADARKKLLSLLEQDKKIRDRASFALSRLPKIIISNFV
jgi:hypothetical protein